MLSKSWINWRWAPGVLLVLGLILGGPVQAGLPQGEASNDLQRDVPVVIPDEILVAPVASFAAGSDPAALIYGPQEALWFTLLGANAIAKIGPLNPPGAVVSTTLPMAGMEPYDLTIGPDQQIWFSEQAGDQMGRLDMASAVSEYPLPTPGAQPGHVTLGQDGGVWFTEWTGNRVGRIGPDGEITEYPLPNPNSRPLGIATALNGDIWFTEWAGARIGRLTPQGELHEYDISGLITTPEMGAYAAEDASALQPTEIMVGPDGHLWFVFSSGTGIVRVDPLTVEMAPYNLETESNGLMDLAIGPDGWLWYLGVENVGRFEASPDGPASPVEVSIEAMFEGEGRSQIIAGPGAEMYFIRLDSQDVYSATVGAAPMRDLQIFINQMPESLLAAGEFEMAVEVWNWSDAPATGVEVELDPGDYIDYVSVTDPGISCAQNVGQVLCQLPDIPAGSSAPFTYTLKTQRIDTEQVEWSLALEVRSAEGDYLPANNRQIRFLTIDRVFRYFNDFSAGSDDHWSHSNVDNPSGSLTYLGGFDNQRVRLSFTDLPPHDWAQLCFDLYVLGAWDGSYLVDPMAAENPPQVIGPDLWSLYIEQVQRLVTSFSNRDELGQAYPGAYLGEESLARARAAQVGNFDRDANTLDARYHLCYQGGHTMGNLVITFYGLNLDGAGGEFWALDNVDVRIFYKVVFDWLYLPLVIR